MCGRGGNDSGRGMPEANRRAIRPERPFIDPVIRSGGKTGRLPEGRNVWQPPIQYRLRPEVLPSQQMPAYPAGAPDTTRVLEGRLDSSGRRRTGLSRGTRSLLA